jgi:5-methylcytosine-specific restriction endonuclease McrA
MAWSSDRPRLPSNWLRIRAKVIREARGICARCHQPSAKLENDHVVSRARRGSDSIGNLRAVRPDCHHEVSIADRTALGRERKARGRRPTERHPGASDSKTIFSWTKREGNGGVCDCGSAG